MLRRLLALLTVTVILSAPALGARATEDRLYYWSSYERDLFQAYYRPKQTERWQTFEATLLRIIEESDAAGRKPPPGLLAEYGYFLAERGEYDTAIEYFEREATEWPESAGWMERLIAKVREAAGS